MGKNMDMQTGELVSRKDKTHLSEEGSTFQKVTPEEMVDGQKGLLKLAISYVADEVDLYNEELWPQVLIHVGETETIPELTQSRSMT